jgi:hypothetical protein
VASDWIELENALDRNEPVIRDAFIAMVVAARVSIDLDLVSELISTGRIEEAFASVISSVGSVGSAANHAFIDAAQDVAKQLNRELGTIIIDFDQTNEWAVRAMRAQRMDVISGFTLQQQEATNLALVHGIRRGENPKELARTFRESIGLTARQVQYVENYRRALEEGGASSLTRELRDRRFDSVVRRAAAGGAPLTAAQIDKMVDRYRDRWIHHRATVIGRTQALRAVHEGGNAMFVQAIGEGLLDPNNLEQRWNTARDERVRGTHKTMHGQLRLFGNPFISGAGVILRFPGDPRAPANEIIQCRCTLGTRIVSLELLTGGLTPIQIVAA